MGMTAESFKRRDETEANKHNKYNQTMKGRHLHMIAIGGSIGAGLFVGTGSALRRGGPASLIVDYSIIGVMMFNVVFALGEMALMYPVSGGFYTLVTRFVDPSWGFAMGWNYFLQWAVILPFEIVVASFTINYWTEGSVSPAIFMAVFLVALTFICCFGALGYAEEEFWSSFLKLSAIVTFLIIGVVLVCGGGPDTGRYNEFWGNRYFQDNGGFKNGFQGFCSVFVTAAFAFAGTELIGLAASESKTPLLTLPSACKQVFWRVTLFYILSLTFVGLLISADDPDLIGGNAFANSQASPFVLVGKYAGLFGYDHFMNVVIMISVISIGLSGVYGGSRTLTALAEQGYAPKFFDYIDKTGRPLYSTILILVLGLLAFAGVDPVNGVELFDWLLALSGLAALFTWGSICLAHIRFRMAWKRQGHTLDELPFHAALGVTGSYIGLGLCILVFIAQMYVAICPVGGGDDGSIYNSPEGFFKTCLAFPVVIFFWVAGYIWKRPTFLTIDKIDVDSGRRDIDWALHRQIQEKRANASFFMKIIYKLF
ncbi:amino-acid permease inda1 [Microdochium trichocladiopsis]|uniref:Amino-acid permease inda1 n=1 Tax=Microdochium trichocladiopsis TaxID=1682393 RepID=A0A9P9BNY6_9PEZI|nr:amino-acid permease inda1 [Microdochium trichocladiopsis]KAH7021343.1 amino-acid permease inda1 [Microdochium trichocladiopsis]